MAGPMLGRSAATGIAPWFTERLAELVDGRAQGGRCAVARCQAAGLRRRRHRAALRRAGGGGAAGAVRAGIAPAYRRVDTCAGEFPAETPYFYSSYADRRGAAAGRIGAA